jgi:single-strand DNA-binding protein
MAVAKFRLAVNRFGKKDEADFISCVAFRKTAEAVDKFTGKGKRVAVEGHIQTGSYKNRDGATVYTTDIVVDNIEFLDYAERSQAPTTNNAPTPQGYHQAPQFAPQQAPQQNYQQAPQPNYQQATMEGFMQVPDTEDGLPFR